MSRLKWDRNKDRSYETGVDRGVLFVCDDSGNYGHGVAWNGLISVTEKSSGGEPTPFWADNVKYLNLLSAESFGATIEAYSFPRTFRSCLGRRNIADGVTVTQQKRQSFGFSFRSFVGNQERGNDWSYKIHIIYGCLASPSEKSNNTVNDSPEIATLSWEVSTLPIQVNGFKPTSEFILDGPRYKKLGLMNVLRAIEDYLYGTADTQSALPAIDQITEIYTYQRYLRDSDGDTLLDSQGRPMSSFVPN